MACAQKGEARFSVIALRLNFEAIDSDCLGARSFNADERGRVNPAKTLELIERNKAKVDYYNGSVYRVISVFKDNIPSYDDQVAAANDAIPVGSE